MLLCVQTMPIAYLELDMTGLDLRRIDVRPFQ